MAIYKPGVRNMGSRNCRLRYTVGLIGFALAAVELIILIKYNMHALYALLIAVPLLLGFEGAFQGSNKFCATYALFGIFDRNEKGSKRGQVRGEMAHSKDMKTMWIIHAKSALASVLVTMFSFIIYSLYSMDGTGLI